MTLVASCAGGRAGAHHKLRPRGKRLRSGIVNLPSVLALHALRVHILGNADNQHTRILVAIDEDLSHRVVVRPVRVRRQELCISLVDHHHVLRAGPVAPVEVAPAQPGSHGAQIAGRHHVDQRTRHVQILRPLHSFRKRQSPRSVSGQGKIVRGSRGLHAGKRTHALNQGLKVRRPARQDRLRRSLRISVSVGRIVLVVNGHRRSCAPAGIPDRHRAP